MRIEQKFASKSKNADAVQLSGPILPQKEIGEEEEVKNGSLMKIVLDHYIPYTLQPNTVPEKTPDMAVRLQVPEKEPL